MNQPRFLRSDLLRGREGFIDDEMGGVSRCRTKRVERVQKRRVGGKHGEKQLVEAVVEESERPEMCDAVERLAPEVLLPGHGPPLVGRRRIARRLALLRDLYQSLLVAVERELRLGTPVPALVEL